MTKIDQFTRNATLLLAPLWFAAAASGCVTDEAEHTLEAEHALEGEPDLLFDLSLDEVEQLHARYQPKATLDATVAKLTAPFDCSLHGTLCERLGREGAIVAIAEQVELGLAGVDEAELQDALLASLADTEQTPLPGPSEIAANSTTALSPLLFPVRSCNTTYSPPAAYPPIDPVALLAGAASDCVVATADSPCAAHHVYSPNPSRELEPLFVFLPGTNMEPDKHDLVLLTAASTGYRSIGLSYDNTVSTANACVGQLDCGLDCQGDMREEVIRGVNTSANVDVARGDSILVRLYRVLEELDSIDPTGGWDAYYVPTANGISGDNIVWDNIIVGGFSQGAGHAAMISRIRQVHGLFILDGSNDTCDDLALGPIAAEWLTAGVDASAGRPKYGFRHDHGTGDTTPGPAWQALGLGTSLFNVDCSPPLVCDVIDTIPPDNASVTAQGHPAAPAICSDHMSMGRDECMPTDFAGATGATSAADARLFEAYARRLCYACDVATCP